MEGKRGDAVWLEAFLRNPERNAPRSSGPKEKVGLDGSARYSANFKVGLQALRAITQAEWNREQASSLKRDEACFFYLFYLRLRSSTVEVNRDVFINQRRD